MTDTQKQTILRRRAAGATYAQIADEVGLSMNTVKSCCRRSGEVESSDVEKIVIEDNKDLCKHCNKKLVHIQKAKPKRFCDNTCRYAYWNTHRDLMNRSSDLSVCGYCGKKYNNCGNTRRKYCSISCGIANRFSLSAGEGVCS